MRNGKFIAPTTLAFVCAGGLAFAQNNPRAANPDTNKMEQQGQKVTDADRDALRMIHQTNQVEMEMGSIAKSNAGSKDVKDYARMLEQDHQKADKQVIAIAKKEQIELTLPKTGGEQKTESQQLDELRHLKGPAFDQKFLQTMVDDHTKAIDEVQKQMNDVNIPQLKSMMQGMLPELKHHRDMAQALLQKQTG